MMGDTPSADSAGDRVPTATDEQDLSANYRHPAEVYTDSVYTRATHPHAEHPQNGGPYSHYGVAARPYQWVRNDEVADCGTSSLVCVYVCVSQSR